MLNDASGFSHIYLLAGYTDMCKGIDGLIAIVAGAFELDPTENAVKRRFSGCFCVIIPSWKIFQSKN